MVFYTLLVSFIIAAMEGREKASKGSGSYCGGDGDAGTVASEAEAAVATAMEDVVV